MSEKNKLQEYCHKNGLSLPIYSSCREGGSDHEPVFRAILTVANQTFEGKGSNKKEAEKNAAKKAYQSIYDAPRSVRPKLKKARPKTCILIDLENKPKIIPRLRNSVFGADIWGFASPDHPTLLSSRSMDIPDVNLVEVPCTRKNGSDVGLILMCGAFLFNNRYHNFIIVSSDSFGYALADCLNNISKMIPLEASPKAVCCKTVESIIQAL